MSTLPMYVRWAYEDSVLAGVEGARRCKDTLSQEWMMHQADGCAQLCGFPQFRRPVD